MTDQLRANANLVDSLSSAVLHGGSALADAPLLIKRVVEEDAWREFVTQRGDLVTPKTFREFVTTPPLHGLGADMDLVDRIVEPYPDIRQLVRDAQRVGQGHRSDLTPLPSESDEGGRRKFDDDTASKAAARLARDHPETYAQVRDGELAVNAAAVLAGIRPRRISVRTDRAESIAASLRSHVEPGVIVELVRLLTEEDQ